ncbi:unnamed protein product [Schistosoma margrebowiei]|uniref:Uncharacterized protein n=1 Tax=Schistosoma margrebowiei TaxID=48269 RepID=A0A3P8HMA7_9TREM|nr:unnamed protein product [Schistosoma margrebowiei]
MFFIPNLAKENVEYPCSYCYVCFQCLCWNVVWSCCFATLDLFDGHDDLFNCWWANIDWEVRGCCFYVGWVQWGWLIQELFEVFFDVGDYFVFLAFH